MKDCGKICQSCAKAKAKQKLVPESKNGVKAAFLNAHLYHTLTTAKAPADVEEKVRKLVGQLMVKQIHGYKVLRLSQKTNNKIDDTSALLKALEKIASREIQCWCQDKAG
jgi:hypothetical protein